MAPKSRRRTKTWETLSRGGMKEWIARLECANKADAQSEARKARAAGSNARARFKETGYETGVYEWCVEFLERPMD